MLKQIVFIGSLIIVAILFVSYFYKTPICPQDFKDPNKRFTSFFEWEKEFRKNNPNSDIPTLTKSRKDFYTENNCKEAQIEPHYEGVENDAISQQLLNIIENYHL